MDLVVTIPKILWRSWLEEGDCAGDPETGEEWAYFRNHHQKPSIEPGDRLYIVAWDRLRGYAPVTRVTMTERGWAICRKGGAVAVTIDEQIPGFRGFRKVWWTRDQEKPFPNWRTEDIEQ